MGAAVVPLMVVSAAAQTYTQVQASRQQQKAAKTNQQIAQYQQADAINRGQVAEMTRRRQISQLLGKQRAAIGASGVAVGQGSPASFLEDQAALGELDVLTLRNNAERQAWGFEIVESQSKFEERSARFGETFGAGAVALGGASRIAQSGPVQDFFSAESSAARAQKRAAKKAAKEQAGA